MYKVDIFTDKLEYASFAMVDGNQNIELDYLAYDAYTIETRLIECKKGYFVHITEDNEFVCDGIVSDVKPDKATQQISIKPIQTMFDEEVFYTPVNDAITWLATNINNTYLNNADTYQNRPINLTYTTYSESFPLTGFNLHETINILSVMISALKTHGIIVDCSLDLPNKHIIVDIHKSDSVVRETTVSEIEVYDGQITTTRYYYAYLLNSDSQAQPARTICTNVINAINNYPNARRFVKVTINGTEFIKEYTGISSGDPGYYDFGNSYFNYGDLGVNDISFHFSNRPSEWALAALVYNTSGPYVNKTINIKVTFYAIQNADFSIDPFHIRADLDNVIESSVTLGDSYGSKNKAEIQKTKTVDDETTYHGVTNFYLHNDGSIDSTDSNRIWPVFRSIENLQQDDDMTDQDWLDAALARAKEILEPQKYDNEIMLTYSKYDKLIHPNDIPIGREVIIYLKGNTYASVLTGKRIKGNEITLIFGVVRTEFTKKLSIEEREKLTFQNTVSAVIAEADDRYVSQDYAEDTLAVSKYIDKTGTASLAVGRFVVSTGNNNNYWVKVCTITRDVGRQGQTVWLRIFTGMGNNGTTTQNTFTDLVLQQGWEDSFDGRFGCNYIFYPLSSGKTSQVIKVMCTNNPTVYDIWVQAVGTYNAFTVFVFGDGRYITDIQFPGNVQSAAPTTGTACNIQGGRIAYTTF